MRTFPVPSTDKATKRLILFGHATVPPINFKSLKPYEHAVRCTLKKWRKAKDRDTVALIHEFDCFLRSLPTPPRQGSVRGLPMKTRAQVIFATIQKQQSQYTSRPSNDGAALRILSRVIAAELYPKPISNPWYAQVQVVRYIMNLMKAEVTRLFGKKHRVKVSRQGRHMTRRIYETVRKFYGLWLSESRRQELLNTKWLKRHSIESTG